MELDEEEDNAVYVWFYDHNSLKFTKKVNVTSYRNRFLTLDIMSNLYRLDS